jgi:hypothetical protein
MTPSTPSTWQFLPHIPQYQANNTLHTGEKNKTTMAPPQGRRML